MQKTSTFVRGGSSKSSLKSPQPPIPQLPPGTKISVHNGQLLISTGLHEFDDILGGGVAIGSILLIEEDNPTNYSQHLLRYFLAEGFALNHEIMLLSPDDPQSFVQNLPTNLTLMLREEEMELDKLEEKESAESQKLTIAWQYEKYLKPESAPQSNQNTSTSNSSTSSTTFKSGTLKASSTKAFCHSYDLARPHKSQSLEGKKVHSVNILDVNTNAMFPELYKKVHSIIQERFRSDVQEKSIQRNILRVGIQSLGSPAWFDSSSPDAEKSLLQFLHGLRGLLRSSLGMCVITLPTHLHSSSFVRRVEQLCDTVVSFVSFEGKVVPDIFSEYHGQFVVKKLARLNSLVTHMPETLNYIFKLGRRKLHIEIPHLGPEESRTAKPIEVNSSPSITSSLCAPSPNKPSSLDF